MVKIISQFLIIYIIVFSFMMIYFYFRGKNKKLSKTLPVSVVYLINAYGINVDIIGIKRIEKHISIVDSLIETIDLLIYMYVKNAILKFSIMFVLTVLLVFIFYRILARSYTKYLR